MFKSIFNTNDNFISCIWIIILHYSDIVFYESQSYYLHLSNKWGDSLIFFEKKNPPSSQKSSLLLHWFLRFFYLPRLFQFKALLQLYRNVRTVAVWPENPFFPLLTRLQGPMGVSNEAASFTKHATAKLSNPVKRGGGDKSNSERFVSCWASHQAIIYFNKASRCCGTQGLLVIIGEKTCFCNDFAKTRLDNLIFWINCLQNNYFKSNWSW